KVREESRILKDVADAPALDGDRDDRLGVGKDVLAEEDAGASGCEEPGDDVDQGRLAAARAAKEGDDPGCRCGEVGVQGKPGPPHANGYLQHGASRLFTGPVAGAPGAPAARRRAAPTGPGRRTAAR